MIDYNSTECYRKEDYFEVVCIVKLVKEIAFFVVFGGTSPD